MRNEREIIEKILDAARQDDSVRVVIRTDLVPKRKYLYISTAGFVGHVPTDAPTRKKTG